MKKMYVMLVLVFLVGGCSLKAAREDEAPLDKSAEVPQQKSAKELRREKRENELQQVVIDARPIIDNLLQAVNTADYDSFVRDLNSSMKGAYHDRGQFAESCRKRKEEYGDAGARPIINAVHGYNQFYLTYLVKFSKTEEPVPVYLCLEREGNRLQVCFLQFRFSTLKSKQPSSSDISSGEPRG